MDNFPQREGNVRRGGTAVAGRNSGRGNTLSNITGVIIGCVFFLVGLSVTAVSVRAREFPMVIFGLVWILISITMVGSPVSALAAGRKKPTQPVPVRRTMAPEEVTHEHIRATGIGKEKQLEQLEVLRGAGLYTEEEYREKKQKILAGK